MDLDKDKQTKKKRKGWAWSSAIIGIILLNFSVTVLLTSKSSALGWSLFAVGLAFLGLALRLMRSSR